MRNTSETFDILNSRDEIYLVITEKCIFSFYFIILGDLRFID